MEYKLSHQQRLLQKMSLTPQMRQSIQLLSMSVKDLSEYIDSVVTNNPFLQKMLEKKDAKEYRKGAPIAASSDPSYEYNEQVKEKVNPRLALLSQLRMSGINDKGLEIAEYLIDEMDDNGYITLDLEEAADNLKTTIEEVEEGLEAIQGMDPPGIGARDVRECLQLQLKRKGKDNSLEYEIVASFLNEVARADFQRISKVLKVDDDKIRVAVDNIKKLNPRPASTIFSKETEKVIPELIARVENNKIRLEVNRGLIPRLKLYNPYENRLDIVKDPEARKFLKENMDFARTLIDNLKRREDTVCRVADYILSFQHEALLKDGHDLKSLTITDVARALDFHPSTISRTVSNKYIQINDKAIPLNNLLSHGIKKDNNGELTSKAAIKNRIEDFIKNEDRAHPLSDNELQKRLEEKGIKIARRTIVKYRKALRILPIYLRKKVKSL